MSSKRHAASDLNHDNWNEEQEPEEAGTFTKAPVDVMGRRVIKRAKRRLLNADGSSKSAFGTFTGFKTSTVTTPPNSSSSAWSLLSANTTNASKPINTIETPASNGASKSNENGSKKKETAEAQTTSSTSVNKKSSSDQEDQCIFKKSSDYFAKLKGLNESVAQWIKTHVDSNPFCILTPIFKDYERYLKEIEGNEKSSQESESKKNETETSKHTMEQAQPVPASDKKEVINTEKKVESSPFGGATMKCPLTSTEWKPEKSIFGNIGSGSKSMFGKSHYTVDGKKVIFGSTEQSADTHKSVFGSTEQKPGTKSIFGNINSEKNPFLSKTSTTLDNKSDEQKSTSEIKSTTSTFSPTNTTTFCFGKSTTTSNTTGFSFGGSSAEPFTFGAQVLKPQESEDKTENEAKDDEDEEPPKAEIKPVTEEGAIYDQRCKVFVKKDGNFSDRGIGVLFLKPTPNGKTQLIVRAETPLGNLLLNTLLTESIPTKRMNKNTIILVCLPTPGSRPPPVPVLLRVKTDEDADALFEALNKHKK